MKRNLALISILLVSFFIGCGGGDGTPPVNLTPIADAGPNQYGQIGVALSFDGSACTDADNDPLTYQWLLIDFPAGSQSSLSGSQTISPSFTPDVEGIYTFQLIVNDGKAYSAPDFVKAATPEMLLDTAPHDIVFDPDGVVYLSNNINSRIYRWSSSESFPLEPIDLNNIPQLMAYAPVNHRLYLGYNNGAITTIDLGAGTVEVPFATTPDVPHGLASAGNFILAADPSGAWHTHYVYSPDGVLVDSEDWNRRSREYAWNGVHERIYFFRDGSSPNDLHYEQIDQTTGQITDDGETPYHGDYDIQPPIRVSQDGASILLGSGDIYDALTLERVNSLPIEPEDAIWMDTGLLTLRASADGRTLLEQWDTDYLRFNVQLFEGSPLRICEWQGGYTVITQVNGRPAFYTYVPNDDGDGDGVPYRQDAFPLDPAASVDTDGDGYPDAWNPGQSQDDSTTGLVLDAFPDDSACL